MGDFLNLVYDDWDDDAMSPNGNGVKNFGSNNFRVFDGLLFFFNFHQIERYRLKDIPKYPDKKFYYVMSHIHELRYMLHKDETYPLTQEVIDMVKNNKNLYVVFVNEHEVETKEGLIMLDKKLLGLGLDTSQFWMINNNSKLEENKRDIGTKINVRTVGMLAMKSARELIDLGDYQFKVDKESKFFLTHNRTPKPHRYALLCLLRSNNILRDVDWSLVMGYTFKERGWQKDYISFYQDIFTKREMKMMLGHIRYFGDIDMKKSIYEEEYTWFDDFKGGMNMHWNKVFDIRTYENTYVNITTESGFFYDEIHLSEKSYKPFYFHQYPLILATYKHLQTLKEKYDLDVFDDIIDHSYDLEPDPRKRFFMFFEEIKRIYKNKDFFIKNYESYKDRFMANQEKIKNIIINDEDNKFFKSLM